MSLDPAPTHTVNTDNTVTVSYPQYGEDNCNFAKVNLVITDQSDSSEVYNENITSTTTTIPETTFVDCKSYTFTYTIFDARLTVSPNPPTTHVETDIGPKDIRKYDKILILDNRGTSWNIF